MKDFLDVLKSRKSIRSFAPTPVARELIETILSEALMAPTNCNQQLWNFVVIDDPKMRERIVKEAAGNTLFRRTPALVVLTYDGWNYKEAIQGASLALGHLLLSANYHGLSASPVNSYGADSKVKKVLGVPEHEVICCFVTLGFPDERAQKAAPVPRKALEEVVHWNSFEKKPRAPYTYNPEDWSLAQLALHQRHYCRKTSLGKEMDLAGKEERSLLKRTLAERQGPFLDLVSYDGSYLRDFPEGELHTVDLAPEVAVYTSEAAALATRSLRTHVYDEHAEELPGSPRTVTLIYKAERLPEAMLQRLFLQAYRTLPKGGELVIVARRRPSLFSAFLRLLRLFFGEDVRKTGIYAFFGPYRPVRVGKLLAWASDAGFTQTQWSGYLAFPGFFEQLYQMMVQYVRSEGSSYLHRDRKSDFISKSIEGILHTQAFARFGVLGSVAVIVCTK